MKVRIDSEGEGRRAKMKSLVVGEWGRGIGKSFE